MLMKGITLRGLEVFEALASSGSVARTATLTGLSQPAVSQQLRNLESSLGTELVDHTRRPMQLTPAGALFGLAGALWGSAGAMREKKLHLAISASTGAEIEGLVEYPVARDPFIIVAPKHANFDASNLQASAALPFLRYDHDQLISKQIEQALQSNGYSLPERFEIGSHLALMAMVARGIGWAITTPMGYMRAHRFHEQVQAAPWPYAPFSRHISVFANSEWADDVPKSVAQTMRRLIQVQMIERALPELPFLDGEFSIIAETTQTTS